jgi:hypothetical protein
MILYPLKTILFSCLAPPLIASFIAISIQGAFSPFSVFFSFSLPVSKIQSLTLNISLVGLYLGVPFGPLRAV